MAINNSTCLQTIDISIDCLLEEKASLENRLQRLGYDGDCAYEKAMVAFYTKRLDLCCEMIDDVV